MKRILVGFLTIVFMVCLQGPIMAAQPKPGYSVVRGKETQALMSLLFRRQLIEEGQSN